MAMSVFKRLQLFHHLLVALIKTHLNGTADFKAENAVFFHLLISHTTQPTGQSCKKARVGT